MTAKRYDFEGERLTSGEINARVPALSITTIRKHLAAGRNTTSAMLTWDNPARRLAACRKAKKKGLAGGYMGPYNKPRGRK